MMFRAVCGALLVIALSQSFTVDAGTALRGPAEPKKVMIWVANPLDQTKIDAMTADLKAHRSGFTGIAYQYFAVCGEGSNDQSGGNDCSDADATGTVPHLAQGHPVGVPSNLGAQLRAALGPDVELWPVLTYGNPGTADVLNRLLTDPVGSAKFAADAVKVAHAQGLTGFNIDFEASTPLQNLDGFLHTLTNALHEATPRIGLSYDTGSNTPAGTASLDRWISMNTYTASIDSFKAGLVSGLASSGSKFGVGLCPLCQTQGQTAAQARFDAIQSIGKGTFRELDLWAYGTGGDWDHFWPLLASWLAAP